MVNRAGKENKMRIFTLLFSILVYFLVHNLYIKIGNGDTTNAQAFSILSSALTFIWLSLCDYADGVDKAEGKKEEAKSCANVSRK